MGGTGQGCLPYWSRHTKCSQVGWRAYQPKGSQACQRISEVHLDSLSLFTGRIPAVATWSLWNTYLVLKNMRVVSSVEGEPRAACTPTASPQLTRGWAGHSLGGIEYCQATRGWQDGRHEAQQALHGSTSFTGEGFLGYSRIIWKAY